MASNFLDNFIDNQTIIRASHMNLIHTKIVKALTDCEYNAEDIIEISTTLARHIANHPSGGNSTDLTDIISQLDNKIDNVQLTNDGKIVFKANGTTKFTITLPTDENSHSHNNKTVLDGITSSKVNQWNDKAETNHSHSEYATKSHSHLVKDITDLELPNMSGYATETFVTNKIAEASLGGGEGNVDLTGFATKDDLSSKVDKVTGKSLVDNAEINRLSSLTNDYTDLINKPQIPSQSEIDNKVDKVDGKELIATTEINRLKNVTNYDDSEIRNSLGNKADKNDLHTHSNKTTLDKITEAKLTELENKATETFVVNKIAEASLGGAEVDLSGYATKTELGTKADKSLVDSQTEKISTLETTISVLSTKLEELEAIIDNLTAAPSFFGLIPYKALDSIELDDLWSIESDEVIKPQTVYQHSGGTVGAKVLVCAFPSEFGTITTVVDGLGTNLIGNSYTIRNTTFRVNGQNVPYTICSTNDSSVWTNAVVIKFNIS